MRRSWGQRAGPRILRVARLTGIHCNLSAASSLTCSNCSRQRKLRSSLSSTVRATTRDTRARLTQHSPHRSHSPVHPGDMYMEGEPFVPWPSVFSSTLPIEPLPAVRFHGTMSHKPGIKIRFSLLTLSWIQCHCHVSVNRFQHLNLIA